MTCIEFWRWGMFFRIKGYGIHAIRAKGYKPLFSERYGYVKAIYVFGLRFQILRPQ